MNTTHNAQTKYIEVSGINIPDHFRDHSEEAQEQLNRDVQEKGQLQEILVEALPDGRYELIDGKGRLTAVKANGGTQIRAQVLSGLSGLDKALIGIAANEEREDVSPIDKAVSYQRAMEVGQIDQAELARRLGMTRAAVCQYAGLAEIPETQRKL